MTSLKKTPKSSKAMKCPVLHTAFTWPTLSD